MNNESSVNKEDFFELTGLRLIDNRFRLLEEVFGGKSSTSFFGVDESTGKNIFVKLSIFPRSELEAARFRNECRFLKEQMWANSIIKKHQVI